MSSAQDCQAEACAIQACIQKNNYNESKCTAAIRALYTCCREMYARDEAARSTACPMPKMVERKLQALDAERR